MRETENIMTRPATSGTEALLSVEHLTKRYGSVIALDDVSFTITDGITGILGENGAGKSTAIKILLGLLPPTPGTAKVRGQDASESIATRAPAGAGPRKVARPGRVRDHRLPRACRIHARARLPSERDQRRRVPVAHGGS